ncbi:PaaI family thioesterase [Pelagibius sp. Alg239-R121]|uniref:PaaI family thioesterase n=1 Tax=Pelagibius sp. Alg239-R121 TaxID=2993448 RepID=UPI0024A644DD|nr:PaaI family thioesterase [Pelagibius sp. Alg239-R121]
MTAMDEGTFGVLEMQALLEDVFAPWIQELKIVAVEVTHQGGRFELPENADLSREGGIICGQAIAAVADTVGVLSLSAHNGRFRQVTTVDMTTHFMRPLMKGSVEAEVTILSNGRRMATLRVDFRQAGKEKICAGATCAYAYLDG